MAGSSASPGRIQSTSVSPTQTAKLRREQEDHQRLDPDPADAPEIAQRGPTHGD